MSVFYSSNVTEKGSDRLSNLRALTLRISILFLVGIFSFQGLYAQEQQKKELTVKEQILQSPVQNNTGIPVEKLEGLFIQQNEQRSQQGLALLTVDEFLKDQNYQAVQRASQNNRASAPANQIPLIGTHKQVLPSKDGGYEYRITDAGRVVYNQSVGQVSDNTVFNKTHAENQALLAMRTYLANPGFSAQELTSQINYQNQVTSQIALNSNSPEAVCNFSGTLETGDPQITGRIFRDGNPSTCAAPKSCPAGTPFGTGTFNYDTHNVTNATGSTQCVSVSAISGTGQQVHVVAYLGSFNPANQCQNYLADQGSSSVGTAVTFSFNLPAGATVALVIYNPTAGTSSTPYTITVNNCPVPSCQPIAITSHPSNASVCPSTNASFTVGATPSGVTYNWQEDRGSGFVYLNNGGVYSGVNAATLNLTGVTAAMNGYRYRCVITCADGGLPEISNPATLTILAAPNAPIISPSSGTICPGGSVQFDVVNARTFSNSGVIQIPAVSTTSGISNPYPATLNVSGLPAGAYLKSVTINGLSHTWLSDVDILLQSPSGVNVVLMSDVSGNFGVSNATYTFDDAAASTMTGSPPANGTWRPTNVGSSDTWVAPGPGAITQATPMLSMFGTEGNGTWRLFIVDDAGGDVGQLSGGWSLNFDLGGVATAIFSPATGLFTDPGLTTPYVAGSQVSTVYASPAATTTYSAQSSNGTCLSSATNFTVTVNQPPAITGQPSTNGNACVGDIKTFSVTATGTGLTYQWQVDQGAGFVNVTNTGPYSGATTNTLTITSVPNAFNGYIYRCVVSGTCPPAQNSNAVTLVVNPQPVITVTPSYVCTPVQLTASGANTYVWSPAAGLSATTGAVVTSTATSPTVYTVAGTNTSTGCVGYGDVMVIGTPGVPTIAPASATICLGGSQLLTVSGLANYSNSGTILVPGSGTSGVASPYPSTINVSGLASSGVSVKSVTLNGVNHTWMSDIDVVLQSPTGVNVVLMSDVSGNFGVTNGVYTFDDAAASTMTGTPPANGTWKPTNVGATDTWAAPGPGTLTQANPALSMFGAGNHNGTWRLFIVDDVGGDVGQITSGWSIAFATGASTVTFSPTTGLFTDAGLTTPYTGGQVSQVYAAPTSTTTYNAVATNTGPSTKSSVTYTGPALTVGTSSGPFSVYPATVNVSGLPTTGVRVKSVKLNGISHTWPDDIDILLQSPTGENVVLMSDIGGSTDVNDVNYTIMDGAAPFNLSSFNPPGVYSPTNDGATDTWTAPLPTSFTQASPSLSMFTGDPNGTWNLFARDDAGGDAGSIQGFEITFEYGTTNCQSAPRSVTITVHNPIVYTQQPANRTACQNDNVSFTVAATGTIQTTQWQVSTDGGTTWTNIAGATSTTLNLTNVQPNMSGNQYRCVMSNVGCGSFNSNPATLTVNPLPTVSLSLNPGGQTQLRPGLLTTVTVNSSPAGATYEWFVNGVAQPGITGSSYVVDAYHLGTYTVRVTDVNGCKNTTAGVTFTAIPTSNLFIYPNPTSGAYFVTYYMPVVGTPVTINVIDMKGRVIEQRQAVTSAPYTRFDFSGGGLAAGVYVIEFRDPGGDRLAAGRLVITR